MGDERLFSQTADGGLARRLRELERERDDAPTGPARTDVERSVRPAGSGAVPELATLPELDSSRQRLR